MKRLDKSLLTAKKPIVPIPPLWAEARVAYGIWGFAPGEAVARCPANRIGLCDRSSSFIGIYL